MIAYTVKLYNITKLYYYVYMINKLELVSALWLVNQL